LGKFNRGREKSEIGKKEIKRKDARNMGNKMVKNIFLGCKK
jgi:hypothetical protein